MLLSSVRRALSSSSRGPIVAYELCVSRGELRRDAVQARVMVELGRLYDELSEYEPPPLPEITLKKLEAPQRNWMSSMASVFGLALGGGSDRPSGSSGPVVSRFGAPQHLARNDVPPSPKPNKKVIFDGAPRGVYLWGGVGSGKTRMMDLFFDTVTSVPKQRVHFNSFMLSVHRGLHEVKQKDPEVDGSHAMKLVARDLLSRGVLLCVDEFQVVDIADALVIKALFEALWDFGAVLVATSNRAPDQLYYNGIQRQLFLPFIPILEEQCVIESVAQSKTDYRIEIGSGETASVYFTPGHDDDWEECKERLTKKPDFSDIAELRVQNAARSVKVPRSDLASRSCLYTFDELCGSARGAADFLAVATAFDTVFLEDVPVMDMGDLNRARRFITLVDELYENHVVLVVKAAALPHELFVKDKKRVVDQKDLLGDGSLDMDARGDRDEAFAFGRTASRLVEMGSSDYLRRAKTRRPPLTIDVLKLDTIHVHNLFRAIDVDQSGYLDKTELAAFLADVSELKRGHRHVPDEELTFAINTLDTDGDGLVSPAELSHYLQSQRKFDAALFANKPISS